MTHVNTIFGVLESLQSIDITVEQNRCAVVRNRNARCTRCADACTSKCISCQEGEIVISPENCIGCGTCATVCPTCALEAHHPNDRELYEACICAMRNAGGEAVIACEQLLQAANGLYDPEKIVGVKCLGRIEESLLILLARAGARRAVLVRGACDECRHHPGSETASLVCDTANALLSAWRQPEIACIAAKLPGCTRRSADAAYDAGRRGFLADVLCTARTTAYSTAEHAVEDALGADGEQEPACPQKVQADGTLPHFLPHRRARLLKGLAAFGEPEDVMVDTRLWGHVVIDADVCTSCQMCATFCPTEAIKKFQSDDGAFGVVHYPSRCVKCRCCTDICPAGALELSDEVFAVDLPSKAFERYEKRPRKSQLGPHQMLSSVKNLLGDEYVYER